jgi:hypothetical protein
VSIIPFYHEILQKAPSKDENTQKFIITLIELIISGPILFPQNFVGMQTKRNTYIQLLPLWQKCIIIVIELIISRAQVRKTQNENMTKTGKKQSVLFSESIGL